MVKITVVDEDGKPTEIENVNLGEHGDNFLNRTVRSTFRLLQDESATLYLGKAIDKKAIVSGHKTLRDYGVVDGSKILVVLRKKRQKVTSIMAKKIKVVGQDKKSVKLKDVDLSVKGGSFKRRVIKEFRLPPDKSITLYLGTSIDKKNIVSGDKTLSKYGVMDGSKLLMVVHEKKKSKLSLSEEQLEEMKSIEDIMKHVVDIQPSVVRLPKFTAVYFVVPKMNRKERQTMVGAKPFSMILYHGTTECDDMSRFEMHINKGRFDASKHGIIIFDSWTADTLNGFKNPYDACYAWELKLGTLKPKLFCNYMSNAAKPGTSVRTYNAELLQMLSDEKFTRYAITHTLDVLRNSPILEVQFKEDDRETEENEGMDCDDLAD